MFSGLVSALGTVSLVEKAEQQMILKISIPDSWVKPSKGQSVAVNGVCLTCVDCVENQMCFEVIHTTYNTTNLRFLESDDCVNLERPVTVSSYLDGHLCFGHVDDIGRIKSIYRHAETCDFEIECSEKHGVFLVPKGSVSVDGVSLTIVSCKKTSFKVSLIPHTVKNTRFSQNSLGDFVNLEFDILGKYVVSHLNSLKN